MPFENLNNTDVRISQKDELEGKRNITEMLRLHYKIHIRPKHSIPTSLWLNSVVVVVGVAAAMAEAAAALAAAEVSSRLWSACRLSRRIRSSRWDIDRRSDLPYSNS